jgi:hypothetical protein
MKPESKSTGSILRKLNLIAVNPDRKPENHEQGKRAFLHQAALLKSQVSSARSKTERQNHKRGFQLFGLKPQFATVLIAFLAVIFVFAGSKLTFAAARNSQPGELLYGAKLLDENLSLAFELDAATRSELSLRYSEERMDELNALLEAKTIPSESTLERYQSQIDRAVYLAGQLGDDEAVTALNKIQNALQTHERQLARFEFSNNAGLQNALVRIRNTEQERIQWVKQGIQDPETFREQFQQYYRYQYRYTVNTGTGTFTMTCTSTQCCGNTQIPGKTANPSQTPMGPGPNATCTPENTPQGPGPNNTPQKTKTPTGPGGSTPTQKVSKTPQGPGPQPTKNPNH